MGVVTETVSLNYSCRACNAGAATCHGFDHETDMGFKYAEIKTQPHYCVDDVVVPGISITVYAPHEDAASD